MPSPLKETISIFWINNKITIPQYFVNSIRLIMGENINIVQLTNYKTMAIPGVNSVKRYELSNDIMIARLEAYGKYIPETPITLFCDADSIMLNKFKFEDESGIKIFICPRQKDLLLNHNSPEYYEEFVNRRALEVMPYLFGAIITIENQQNFFKELLSICLFLPKRFHRWYGDQYSLSQYIKKGFDKFKELDPKIYNNIQNDILSSSKILELVEQKTQIITFKGEAKKNLKYSFEKLNSFINEKQN